MWSSWNQGRPVNDAEYAAIKAEMEANGYRKPPEESPPPVEKESRALTQFCTRDTWLRDTMYGSHFGCNLNDRPCEYHGREEQCVHSDVIVVAPICQTCIHVVREKDYCTLTDLQGSSAQYEGIEIVPVLSPNKRQCTHYRRNQG